MQTRRPRARGRATALARRSARCCLVIDVIQVLHCREEMQHLDDADDEVTRTPFVEVVDGGDGDGGVVAAVADVGAGGAQQRGRERRGEDAARGGALRGTAAPLTLTLTLMTTTTTTALTTRATTAR